MELQKQFVAASLLFTVLFSCSRKTETVSDVHIMADVSGKQISINEFIKRAEYTIRPPYCHGDNYIHKKIVLNSLVAEKLLALEAGVDNELTRHESFQNYIQGRKEQAMRQWLYNKMAVEKVVLDSSEIKKTFKLAGRTYKLDFINLKDSTLVSGIKAEASQPGESFYAIAEKYLGNTKIPVREVSWDSPEEAAIHDALFTQPLQKGQLVGPIFTDDGHSMLMHVNGWIDRPVISDKAVRERWDDVEEKLTKKYAEQLFRQYAAQVMKGKQVDFATEVFFKLAEFFAPFYLKTQEQKKAAFNQKLWNNEIESGPDIESGNIDGLLDKPLLRIDGQVWKVSDFKQELSLHPLVFRKRQMSKREFPEQFKLAIVDMIRDKYLTQEAYKKGYDTAESVIATTNMWKDNMLALYEKNKYLKSIGVDWNSNNYIQVIKKYLNTYVDSLQAKYDEVIEINTDALEAAELTKIDMFAIQKDAPFPVIVPQFPLLTSDTKLDYGKKMESSALARNK